MKKFVAAFLAAITLLSVVMFTACAKPAEEVTLNFILPSGSPAVSAAKLISEHAEIEGVKINYQVVNGPDQLAPSLIKDSAQLAVVPANIASNVYNRIGDAGDNIKLLSVNVHGALYIVGKEDLTSLEDLKGEVLYSIGQTGTPAITLKYILQESNIDFVESDEVVEGKVAIKYVAGAPDVLPLLKQQNSTVKYALLAEPAVTQAIADGKLKVAFDLQKEWKKITNATYDGIPQAVFVAKQSVVEKYPKLIAKVLEIMEENTQWLANTDNASKAVTAINTILGQNSTVINEGIITRSSIRVVRAEQAKESLMHYFGILHTVDAKSIGGKLPDDNLFYIASK